MRLYDAMLAAIQHNAALTRPNWTDTLRIRGDCFYGREFRAKHGGSAEIRLNARDCLADDWILVNERADG